MASNEFDQIAESLGSELGQTENQAQSIPSPQAPQNEYDSIVNQAFQDEREQQKDALKGASFVAAQANPDQTARAMKLAQKYNLPPSMVDMIERNTDVLDREDKQKQIDLDKMVEKYPKTTKFLSNPNNAKLAMDDHGNLTTTEDKFKEYGLLSDAYNSLASGVLSTVATLGKAPGAMTELSDFMARSIVRWDNLSPINVPKNIMDPQWASDLKKKADEEYAKKVPALSESVWDEVKKGEYAKGGRTLFLQMVNNTPNLLMLATTSMVGLPELGLGLAGATTATQSLDESRQNGQVNDKQRLAAIGKGVIEAGFESLGTFGILKQWEKELAAQVGKKASAETIKAFTKTWLYSVAAEGNEEGLTSIAQDLTDYVTGNNPEALKGLWGRAIDSALVGAGMGGTGVAGAGISQGLINRSQQNPDITTQEVPQPEGDKLRKFEAQHHARESALARDFYLSLGDDAQASKARERLPESYVEHVDGITKDGPIQNVFIETEDFKRYSQDQNLNPVKVAQELGILDEFTKAEETGAPITVSLGKWANQAVDTDHFKGIANDVRLKEDALSPNQAKQLNQSLEDDLKKEAEDAKKIEDNQPNNIKEAQEIGKTLKTQLQEAGYKSQEAKDISALPENFFRAYVGERAGISPKEFFDRYGLSISKGNQEVDLLKGELGAKTEDLQFSDEEIRILEQSGVKPPTKPGTNVVDVQEMFKKKQQENVRPTENDLEAQRLRDQLDELYFQKRSIEYETPEYENILDKMHEIRNKLGRLDYRSLEESVFKDLTQLRRDIGKKFPKDNKTDLGKRQLADRLIAVHENENTEPGTKADIRQKLLDLAYGETEEDIKKKKRKDEEDLVRSLISKIFDSKQESIVELRVEQISKALKTNISQERRDSLINELKEIAKTENLFDELVISDHGKEMLRAFAARFSDKNGEKLAYEAQKINAGPYVADKRNSGVNWIPNFMAEPTGTIGEPRIQEPHDKNGEKTPDPLMWADAKYEVTKELIKKHKDQNKELVINTSSDLIAIDYIEVMPPNTTVNMYLATPEDHINRLLFPGNPSRLRQESAIKKLKEAGIKVRKIEPTVDSIIEAVGSEKEIAKRLGIGAKAVREYLKGRLRPELKVLKQSLPGFYSKLQQTIEEKLPNSVSTAQLKASIKDVKADEIKWSGIDEFIRGKEKVDKVELLDFLRANELKIEEVEKGGEKQKIQVGATVYGLFNETGDWYGSFASEFNAKQEAQRIADESGTFVDYFSIQPTEWDGETTLEDIEFTAPGGPTKFSQYVLPGKAENYRELLLKLPEAKRPQFRTFHWEESNILAHVRVDERTTTDGEKVLFANEIQSDWGQKGRREGFKTEAAKKAQDEFEAFSKELAEKYDLNPLQNLAMFSTLKGMEQSEVDKYEQLQSEWLKYGEKAVPDMPFSKTWHEFAFKRLIREAAEKGFTRLAWVTGEQASDMFDLSKQVSEIQYANGKEENTYSIHVISIGNTGIHSGTHDPSKLEEIIGKDLAKKIIEGATTKRQSLVGASLKMPSQGQVGFYDKIIVDFAKKFGKKFGAKVEDVSVGGKLEAVGDWKYKGPEATPEELFELANRQENEESHQALFNLYENIKEAMQDGRYSIDYFNTAASSILGQREAKLLGGELIPRGETRKKETVHSIEITPAMREAALGQGFELFQKGETPRGQIRIGKQKMDITLFEGSDTSTPIHEFAHASLEMMGDMFEDPSVNQEVKDDYQVVLNYLGVTNRSEIETEHHEKFASSLEQYLLEGKSPSERLRSVFHRLKNLFKSIYNYVKSGESINGVKLNPEIRKVFDRMFATDKEIEKVMPKPMFPDPASMGMSPQLVERYLKAQDEAKTFAEDLLRAKMMKDLKKEERADYKALKESATTGWTKTANEMPVYKLLSILQDGIMADGSEVPLELKDAKLDRVALSSIFGEYIIKSLPKNIMAENGIHPQVLADAFGFKSVTQMVDQISTTMPKKAFIQMKVQELLDQTFPDPMKNNLPDEAIRAMYNDKLAEMKQIELEHLAANNMGTLKQIIKKVVARPPEKPYIKQNAEKIISEKKISEINPRSFYLAERRSAKQAGESLAKGDIQAAFEWKRKEQLNSYLYRAAQEAKDAQVEFKDELKRFQKKDSDLAGKRDLDLINAGRKILAHYNLIALKDPKKDPLALLKEYDPDGYSHVNALIDGAMVLGKNDYNQLTFAEFQDLRKSLNAIWNQARKELLVEIEGKKLERAQVITELGTRLSDLTGDVASYRKAQTLNFWGKLKEDANSFKSQMVRIENWIDYVDGTFGGPFRRYIWNPVNEAVIKYRLAKNEVLKKYEGEILDKYSHLFDKIKEIDAYEIDYKFKSNAELIMAILHSGNESNMDKLVRGRDWVGYDVEAGKTDFSKWKQFLSRAMHEGIITKEHMDLAQDIWNLMESFKAGTQKAHKEIYGHYFDEISANAIQTPWGEYKGGYIPAVVDPYLNQEASLRKTRNELEEQSFAKAFPSTGRGATMKRVQAYAEPLSLEMNILGAHIDWALRFTHIQPAIKDVSKIVMNRSFREYMERFDDKIINNAIVPWLQRASTQRVMDRSRYALLDKVAGYLRRNASLQIMFASFSNGLQQLTGVFPAMAKVGPKHFVKASTQFLLNPIDASKQMNEISPFMRSFTDNNVYETQQSIKEILVDKDIWTNVEKVQNLLKKHGQIFAQVFQGAVNTISWNAALNQQIEDGKTIGEAIKFADSTVRMTQGTGLPESISNFETGSPVELLFKQFISYFNMLANLQLFEAKKIIRDVHTPAKYQQLVYLYLMAHAIPSILAKAIFIGVGSGFQPDDEDEFDSQMADTFLWSQLDTAVAMLPFGQALNAAKNAFNKKPYDDRISFSPGIQILETALNVPGMIYRKSKEDEDFTDQDMNKIMTGLGFIAGLPIAPVWKRYKYIEKAADGEIEPATPIHFVHGVLTGKARNDE